MNLQEEVNKGFQEVIETLQEACPLLKRKFELVEKNDDAIAFDIDGYRFTLDWEVFEKPLLSGRLIKVSKYRLCVWETIPATRHAPEEQVDKTIVETELLHYCVKEALLAVAKDEVRAVLENVGYGRQLREEKQWEEA